MYVHTYDHIYIYIYMYIYGHIYMIIIHDVWKHLGWTSMNQ